MQEAVVVLDVLRERGRKGLPFTQLYRQMFNKELYLLAYGNIYSNQGAMTPGAGAETADGMSEGKIDQIIEAMRHERYRFSPARRAYIPKKRTGSYGLWACRPGPISWLAKRFACFLRRSTSRGFPTGPTGSGKGEGVIPRCGRYTTPGAGPRGLSRVISPIVSEVLIMRSFSEFWRRKSRTNGSCG